VSCYHNDNGIFAGKEFQEDVQAQHKIMSYCSVGKLIHNLEYHECTVLLHAQQQWPEIINKNLWSYAFVLCAEIRKWTPRSSEGCILFHVFCCSQVGEPPLQHLYTFGCPVFVMDSALQGGIKTHKLISRSRIGVYLGASTSHARSIHMILSIQTGHVSPLFHIYFDDIFETVREINIMPQS